MLKKKKEKSSDRTPLLEGGYSPSSSSKSERWKSSRSLTSCSPLPWTPGCWGRNIWRGEGSAASFCHWLRVLEPGDTSLCSGIRHALRRSHLLGLLRTFCTTDKRCFGPRMNREVPSIIRNVAVTVSQGSLVFQYRKGGLTELVDAVFHQLPLPLLLSQNGLLMLGSLSQELPLLLLKSVDPAEEMLPTAIFPAHHSNTVKGH
ncbi:hypothetical protein LAZ67_11001800, partial [Cordylochernes scorpioides]